MTFYDVINIINYNKLLELEIEAVVKDINSLTSDSEVLLNLIKANLVDN